MPIKNEYEIIKKHLGFKEDYFYPIQDKMEQEELTKCNKEFEMKETIEIILQDKISGILGG
jgi:hypothetical protein